jgi:hypothetical protein
VSPFAVVVVVVCVLGIATAAWVRLRLGRPLAQLGRRGGLWFENPAERPASERPSGDRRDPPLPHRELRGRPE